jgi:hypothetical protein
MQHIRRRFAMLPWSDPTSHYRRSGSRCQIDSPIDGPPARIGKEVDRLDEDENYRLDATDPGGFKLKVDEQLSSALAKLGDRATHELAAALFVSERRLRDVLKNRAVPRKDFRNRIIDLAKQERPRRATRMLRDTGGSQDPPARA